MADLKLFRLSEGSMEEIKSEGIALEKSLQSLLEANLEAVLGIRFLATEYNTGKTHGGRIDSLGIDENGSPVIIEYKRALNENVINQGLFYLDWLLDHKADFELLVLRTLGQEVAESVDWSGPRLLCIAGDFTRYDVHAVQQINRNVELIRHRKFGPDLVALELVNAASSTPAKKRLEASAEAPLNQQGDLFEGFRAFALALGDDVQEKELKHYTAFRRIRNFACVEFRSVGLRITARLNPDTVTLEPGFTRDLRGLGHHGTGDLEIVLRSQEDLERAKPLILRAYEDS